VRSINPAAASQFPSHQSLKDSQTSLIDTFHRISLPGDAASVSYAVADESRSVLPTAVDLNVAYSSSSDVTTAGYFMCSPGYLSPTGSVETAALRELQAFAGEGGMDHTSTQSPDTTDSAGSQVYAESSSFGQPTSFIAVDDSSRDLKESKSSSSSSLCTMCGRGCGCQKRSEDAVCRRASQDSASSWRPGSLTVESRYIVSDVHDCQCALQSSSASAFSSSSSSSSPWQQQQSHVSDVMSDADLFSRPHELSSTLQELSLAARETPTGGTVELIEHTIQVVVDAHVNTCFYTSDKVAAGLREYELKLSTKPLVNSSLYDTI